MNVLVISKRVFRVECVEKIESLLRKLRATLEIQRGFISRTTYSKLNDPVDCSLQGSRRRMANGKR